MSSEFVFFLGFGLGFLGCFAVSVIVIYLKLRQGGCDV